MRMYRIKLKKSSKNEFDEIFEVKEEMKALQKYCDFRKENYFFGSLVKVVEGKEQNHSSFCNSEFA